MIYSSLTYLLIAALPLYPHPAWVGAVVGGPFMASGAAALAGGTVAIPPLTNADCCGGLLVLEGGAPSTFFISKLAGDPMTLPTKVPASTSDI